MLIETDVETSCNKQSNGLSVVFILKANAIRQLRLSDDFVGHFLFAEDVGCDLLKGICLRKAFFNSLDLR